MNYFDIEHHVLVALERLDAASIEALAYELKRDYGYLQSPENLSAMLTALSAGGYITVGPENGSLSPASTVTLTEKGHAAIQIGGMAKLFSGMKEKAMLKNERAFCALARPAAEPFAIDTDAFADYHAAAAKDVDDGAVWTVQNAEDGLFTLCMQRLPTYEEDEDETESSGISLLFDRAELLSTLHDLADTALYLTESHKARKILLGRAAKAYVMTFCEVADEAGYTVFRVTAAPVLFNRRRFIGKRDSDLDYAQCGSNVLSFTASNAFALYTAMYYSFIERIDLLDEALGQKVNTLYQKIC